MEIVVGFDGSEGSRASLDRAIELAGPLGDTVTVVFGYAPPGIYGGEIVDHADAVKERGGVALQEAEHQAAAKGSNVKVATKLLPQHATEALLEEAEGVDCRMIVVGNQGGPSPLRGALLGSVPYKLVHLSPVPVLVVPSNE
jgi:nucleotide-binding universal stress UspA family protein